MVRNYKKKGKSYSWTRISMQSAVDAVINNVMGYHKAALVYQVPQTTLERHVKKQKDNPSERLTQTTDVSQAKCVFNKLQEQRLVNYLVSMKQSLFGINSKEVRALAFQLANRTGQDHPFNKEEGLAGIDWFIAFQKRHPELTLKRAMAPPGTASTSVTPPSLNKAEVERFFDILEDFARRGLTAHRIFNAGELGIIVNTRSLVKRTRRKCFQNGNMVTVEVCFSAAGEFMPPMLVFPSDNDEELTKFEQGLPPGSWAKVSPRGRFFKNFYFEWFKKFVVFSKASMDSPVVLLVDGNSPYIKNLELLDYANEHGVSLLCFPVHSLSRLEPISVSFVKTVSLHYEDEVRLWLQTHPGQTITASHVSPLFGSAYLRAATVTSAKGGFARTGVWPVVRLSVIQESDFLSEVPTDDQHESFAEEEEESILDSDMFTPVILSRDDQPEKTYLRGSRPVGCKAGLSFKVASALSPILKSRTYTSALRAPIDGGKIVKRASEEKKETAEKKESASPDSNASPSSGDIQDNYDLPCLYCNDFYSNAVLGWWIRCEQCLRWAHHSCAGFDDENDQVCSHICKMCA